MNRVISREQYESIMCAECDWYPLKPKQCNQTCINHISDRFNSLPQAIDPEKVKKVCEELIDLSYHYQCGLSQVLSKPMKPSLSNPVRIAQELLKEIEV